MAVEQTIRGVYLGEDKELLFDQKEDVSAWTVQWEFRNPAGTLLLTKTTGASEIVQASADSGALNGLAVLLFREDTEALAAGLYAFELRRVDPGHNTVLSYGSFPLAPPAASGAGFYSSASVVQSRTGIGGTDLGMSEEELPGFLEDLLTEITNLMNQQMHRDYLQETVIPPGVHGIAADIAASSIREMVTTRQTPVVRIDDFAIKTISTRVFSPDIEKRLRLYGRSMGTVDVGAGYLRGATFDDELVQILDG